MYSVTLIKVQGRTHLVFKVCCYHRYFCQYNTIRLRGVAQLATKPQTTT